MCDELIGNYLVHKNKDGASIKNLITSDVIALSWDEYYAIHEKLSNYYETIMDI